MSLRHNELDQPLPLHPHGRENLRDNIYQFFRPFAGQERYTKGPRIADGGLGVVYLGYDTKLQMYVAIKTTQWTPDTEKWNALQHMLRDEAIHSSKADTSANTLRVIRVLDIINDPNKGENYLIMEHIRPDEYIFLEKVYTQKLGNIPLELSTTVLKELGDVIDASWNAGIVHSDLKLGNIAFGTHIKLFDFGISRNRQRTETPRYNFGSLEYISPERIANVEKGLTQESEIWSYGVIAFQLLIGELPFSGYDEQLQRSIRYDHPWKTLISSKFSSILTEEELASLIKTFEKLLAKLPEHRPKSGKEAFELLVPHIELIAARKLQKKKE